VLSSSLIPFRLFRESTAFHCFATDFGETYPDPAHAVLPMPYTRTAIPAYQTRWLGVNFYVGSGAAGDTSTDVCSLGSVLRMYWVVLATNILLALLLALLVEVPVYRAIKDNLVARVRSTNAAVEAHTDDSSTAGSATDNHKVPYLGRPTPVPTESFC
jgi:hypothetical protein